MPALLGIIGKKGAGKSFVSKFLCSNYDCQVVSMSTPIKQIACCFGFPPQSVYGTQADKEKIIPHTGISGRDFMQKFGTDFGREIFPKLFPKFHLGDSGNIWLQLLNNNLTTQMQLYPTKLYVLDDIRFQDEADYIRKKNGILLKIVRNNTLTNQLDDHKSETTIDHIESDYIIDNSNTKDELKIKIIEFLALYHFRHISIL
jgi:hypothetical protein